jgi:hypothetical protein
VGDRGGRERRAVGVRLEGESKPPPAGGISLSAVVRPGGSPTPVALSGQSGTMPTMSEPTHATIATFRMDMSREDEQRRGLREFLVPRVSQHAGFLSGNWMLDREAEESVVVVTFSSRHAAEAFQKNVESNVANQASAAIELVKIRVLEVTASA